MYEKVTIGVINYNGEKVLDKTLTCLKDLDYPDYQIMLIDGRSTDQSIKLTKEKFPDVRIIIEQGEHLGSNAARNTAILESKTRLVLLVDNDIHMKPDLLKLLVNVMNEMPNAAICAPVIAYLENPKEIKYGGTSIHYIGESIIRQGKVNYADKHNKPIRVDAVSTGTILVDKDVVLRIHLFDEDISEAWGDGDFTFRITMAGFSCVIVPQAIVLHEKGLRGLKRAYYQIRNRWFFILRVYSLKTLILVFPMLLMYEIGLIIFLVIKGKLSTYLLANLDVIKNIKTILRKRKTVQSLKKLPDSETLKTGSFFVAEDVVYKGYQKVMKDIFNFLFDSYWRVIKRYV